MIMLSLNAIFFKLKTINNNNITYIILPCYAIVGFIYQEMIEQIYISTKNIEIKHSTKAFYKIVQ